VVSFVQIPAGLLVTVDHYYDDLSLFDSTLHTSTPTLLLVFTTTTRESRELNFHFYNYSYEVESSCVSF